MKWVNGKFDIGEDLIEFGMEFDDEFHPFIDDDIENRYSIKNPINKYARELMGNEIID